MVTVAPQVERVQRKVVRVLTGTQIMGSAAMTIGMAYDRGINPAGSARQLAAIIASGDRTPLLRQITAPTLVIHGTKDKLVPPSGGRATARAIPGARLLLIEGMAHDLPRGAWPRMLDAIEQNAARSPVPAV